MRTFLSLNPFTDMRRVAEMMDRMAGPDMESLRGPAGLNVPMDIWEENGAIFVKASLPGVKPEDVNLSIDDNVLTISGEIQDDHSDHPGRKVYHREHVSGRFVRSVRLPEDVDENNIDAEYDNGFLLVRIPRTQKQEQKPKQLQVRTRNSGQQQALQQGGGHAYADKPSGGSQQSNGSSQQSGKNKAEKTNTGP